MTRRLLTFVSVAVTSRQSRSSRGASGCDPDAERGAVPAGGARNPALGRLRDPARPALQPVCEELAALAPGRAKSPFASGDSRKRGPRLSGGVRSPKREPRWSAERRARSDERASAPAVLASGNTCWRGADNGWMRLSALRLPSVFLAEREKNQTKLGRRCVARTKLFLPLPAARGEVGLRSNPGEGALPRF